MTVTRPVVKTGTLKKDKFIQTGYVFIVYWIEVN